jgi:Na+/proline symporter
LDNKSKYNQSDTKKDVISDYLQDHQKQELQSAKDQVWKARNALFAVAGFALVFNLIVLVKANYLYGLPLIVALLVPAIFTGLAFMTKKQPFTAIILGLVVYIGMWLFDIIIFGTEELFENILFKIVIIYFLIAALKHARRAEKLQKKLKEP